MYMYIYIYIKDTTKLVVIDYLNLTVYLFITTAVTLKGTVWCWSYGRKFLLIFIRFVSE